MEIELMGLKIGSKRKTIIGGPCAIESYDMAMECAAELLRIASLLDVNLVFKGSFDKANRLSGNSERGIGFKDGLKILADVREYYKIPVLTDVHESNQVSIVKDFVDILQIPAFLCRQTDLILEASRSGLCINIKKGQFVSPNDMWHILNKGISTGNDKIMLTERGTFFGYGDLIFDTRGLVIMKGYHVPVIVDITHLCQKPGAADGATSGDRRFIIPYGKVALALDADGLYLETHPEPSKAISDRETQIPLRDLERVLREIFGKV